MSTAVYFLFFTIVTTYAYKCNEEGCSINHTEDNRNFEQPRNEYLVLEDARSIKRTAPYGVVRPPQRMKISSKMEDGTRKENGSYKILNENPKNYPKISSRTGGVAEDRVVFPGPTSDTFVPVIPEECKRNGICEDVPNYPEEAVANLVASLSQEKRKFQIDQLDIPEIPDIAQRLGPQEENMELCSFREEIVYPKAAPDKDGIWHIIVNPKEKPVQGVRVEICTNDKSSCAEFAKFERGYEARCVQKYFRRPMQCLDQSGGLVEKPLMLPSCCSCVARTV